MLDEPTSALDLQTEARLENDLMSLCAGRTTLIVAHRLSTLRSVDRVLVFEAGRVIEDGSPEELLANGDTMFARLHALAAVAPRCTSVASGLDTPSDGEPLPSPAA